MCLNLGRLAYPGKGSGAVLVEEECKLLLHVLSAHARTYASCLLEVLAVP